MLGAAMIAAPAAQAAITTERLTGVSQQAASLSAAATWGTSTSAVVADTASLPIASALAVELNAPLVIRSGSTTTPPELATLSSLGVSDLHLVGTTSTFPTAYRTAVAGIDSSPALYLAGTGIKRSNLVTAAFPAPEAHVMVSGAEALPTRIAATAFAAQQGAPLSVLSASDAAADVAVLAGHVEDIPIYSFSPPESLPPGILAADRTAEVVQVGADFTSYLANIEDDVRVHTNPRTVVTSHVTNAASPSVAIALAQHRNSVYLPLGTGTNFATGSLAHQYIALWKADITSATMVGENLTTAHGTNLAAASNIARETAPTFRVTTASLGTGNFTLTVNKPAGVSSLQAYDATGDLVGTSTTSTLTVSGESRSLIIVGLDGSGFEVDYFDFKVNDFASTTATDSVVLGSASSGKNHSQLLSTSLTPRLVIRYETDPGSTNPLEGPGVPVAFTCSNSYTETSPDATKQWRYEFHQMSASSVACGAASNSALPDGLVFMGVVFPATAWAARTAPESDAADGDVEARRPSMSILETAVSNATDEDGAAQMRGPGDDWPDFRFRYDTYIREVTSWAPYYGSLTHPIVVFGGDHPRTETNWVDTYRYRLQIDAAFGSDHRLYNEFKGIGETTRYHCNAFGCILHDKERQSNNTISTNSKLSYATSASWTWYASSGNPLAALAPPIDANLKVSVRAGKTTLVGWHDRMPVHEVSFGQIPGSFHTVYTSGWASVQCLANGHLFMIPGCQANVNITL